jgi:hypothetical protein
MDRGMERERELRERLCYCIAAVFSPQLLRGVWQRQTDSSEI